MRLRRSSRIGSRKSPRSVLVLILVAGIAAALPARISHSVSTESHPAHLSITIGTSGIEPVEFLMNIESGYRSQIEFTMNFTPERRPILRQTALPQFEISYEGWFDPFLERYVITTNEGATYTFREASDFWSFFFELPDFRVPWSALEGGASNGGDGTLVLETRVTYRPIVFAPGLRILAILLPEARQRSEWTRAPLAGPR